MAHFIFMTRGHWNSVKPALDRLRNMMFPIKRFTPDRTALESKYIEARLCPIQLWDYTYPKDQQDSVLNTILQGSEGKGVLSNVHLQKYMAPIRWALKLNPIPDYKKDLVLNMPAIQDTEVIALGVKDDKWRLPNGDLVEEKDKPDLSVEEW